MYSICEMTLLEVSQEIEKQREKVSNAAVWKTDKKMQLWDIYDKLKKSIDYLCENKQYFTDYYFMNNELIRIGQKE